MRPVTSGKELILIGRVTSLFASSITLLGYSRSFVIPYIDVILPYHKYRPWLAISYSHGKRTLHQIADRKSIFVKRLEEVNIYYSTVQRGSRSLFKAMIWFHGPPRDLLRSFRFPSRFRYVSHSWKWPQSSILRANFQQAQEVRNSKKNSSYSSVPIERLRQLGPSGLFSISKGPVGSICQRREGEDY